MALLPALLALAALQPTQDVDLVARARAGAESARREPDPARRLALFAEAEALLEAAPDGVERARAELLLAPAHAVDLEQALELDPTRDELRATLRTVAERALARTAALAAPAGPELPADVRLERWRAVLARAGLALALASAGGDGGALDGAQAALERLRQEAGDESAPGLSARIALARVLRAHGERAAAAEHARFVLTRVLPEDPASEAWRALAPAARAERFRLAELACPELVEPLSALGQHAEAARWALLFLDAARREGFTLSDAGQLARLAALRALGAARGWVAGTSDIGRSWLEPGTEPPATEVRAVDELALEAVTELRAQRTGTILDARARALGREILERTDATAPAETFLAWAREALATGAFEVARTLLENARARARVPPELAPAILAGLGEAWAGLGDPHASARAYRAAVLDEHASAELRARAAEGYYRQALALCTAAGDGEAQALLREAEDLAARHAGGDLGRALRWRAAERARAEGDPAAARAFYRAIEDGAEQEPARVKAALCLQELGDAATAAAELADYLDRWLPAHPLEDEALLAARRAARAQALLALARLADARHDPAEVCARLVGFAQEFAAERELVPLARALLIEAHIARNELEPARALESELARDDPDHPVRERAALALHRALAGPLAAAEGAGEHARARALALERAGHLHTANRVARAPSFVHLRAEAELWRALARPADAAAALARLVVEFDGQAEHAAELAREVRPELGRALLDLGRTDEAFTALAPLVPSAPAAPLPPAEVVRDWCRAVIGWLAGSGPPFTVVPGARAAAGLERRAVELLDGRIEAERAAGGAWSCARFELEWERAYALRRAAVLDPALDVRLAHVRADLAARLGGPALEELARYGCGADLRLRFLELAPPPEHAPAPR